MTRRQRRIDAAVALAAASGDLHHALEDAVVQSSAVQSAAERLVHLIDKDHT